MTKKISEIIQPIETIELANKISTLIDDDTTLDNTVLDDPIDKSKSIIQALMICVADVAMQSKISKDDVIDDLRLGYVFCTAYMPKDSDLKK